MWIGDSIHDLRDVPGPIHLAIGVFDGIHRGHQAVIDAAIQSSQRQGGSPVVLTFDPHPLRVLRPERPPALLTCTEHKILLLKRLGVHHLLLIPFTKDLATTEAEDFILAMVGAAQPLKRICVGHEWGFGQGRRGNVELLTQLGRQHDFAVSGVAPVLHKNQVVSSTLIRAAVRSGDLQEAGELLGRPYTILGRVVTGQGLGSKLGFPTANLQVRAEQQPPPGVYVCKVCVNQTTYPAVANLGFRPTINDGEPSPVLEVHLLDFQGDLYDQSVELEFIFLLRPEQRFEQIADLIEQIGRDVETAREYFQSQA
ncbi:MAG: bifunctional riboflavin kinase/FAD synthetase [Verrucomicrobiales bacterium]